MNRSQLIGLGIVALAAALLLFGRLPSHTNDFCDPDVAQLAYAADDLLAGGVIYENCVETKPPGTYLIFAASFALFGRSLTPVYLLATVLHLLTLLLLARVAWRGAGPTAGAVTAVFYTALAICVGAAGNCPNHETWATFPVAAAFALLLPVRDRLRDPKVLLAGLLLGLALLMKQQAAVFALAAVAWLALEKPFDAWRLGRRLAWISVGFFVPLMLVGAYWASRGALSLMLADLHPQRLGSYLGAVPWADALPWAWQRTATHLHVSFPAWLAAVAGGVFWLRGRDDQRIMPRLLIFLAAACVAVAGGTRFFSHYYILLAAPLAWAGGHGAALVFTKTNWPRWARATLAVLVVLALLGALRVELTEAALVAAGRDLTDPAFAKLIPRDLDLENRVADREHQALGRYVAERTAPDEPIYIWPYRPQVYFWAARRAPTKHYCYFDVAVGLPTSRGPWHVVVGPDVVGARTSLLGDLAASPPRYVVFPAAAQSWDQPFEQLQSYVRRWYTLDADAPGDDVLVYRRAAP